MKKVFKKMICMMCLTIMLGSNTIAMAKDIEDIPVSIISIPSYKKEDIKDIKEGTVVVHKDGSITNLTLNKDLKNVYEFSGLVSSELNLSFI
jgi:hypothetical protein